MSPEEFKRDVIYRHMLKAVPTVSGCVEWMAARLPTGYGKAWLPGKLWNAHRLFYTAFVGVIPPGMVVCHRCDNPACVRPDHLFAGSQSQNLQDSKAKGRFSNMARGAPNKAKTHCKYGHPFSGENLYIHPNGARRCVTCRRLRDASLQKT